MDQDNIENTKVQGVTWKQMLWLFVTIVSGLMSIEATILGIYYKQDSRITTSENKIQVHDASFATMRVDVDVLKVHQAGYDAELKSVADKAAHFNYVVKP